MKNKKCSSKSSSSNLLYNSIIIHLWYHFFVLSLHDQLQCWAKQHNFKLYIQLSTGLSSLCTSLTATCQASQNIKWLQAPLNWIQDHNININCLQRTRSRYKLCGSEITNKNHATTMKTECYKFCIYTTQNCSRITP